MWVRQVVRAIIEETAVLVALALFVANVWVWAVIIGLHVHR